MKRKRVVVCKFVLKLMKVMVVITAVLLVLLMLRFEFYAHVRSLNLLDTLEILGVQRLAMVSLMVAPAFGLWWRSDYFNKFVFGMRFFLATILTLAALICGWMCIVWTIKHTNVFLDLTLTEAVALLQEFPSHVQLLYTDLAILILALDALLYLLEVDTSVR